MSPEFSDELDHDTLPNRILLATLTRLTRYDELDRTIRSDVYQVRQQRPLIHNDLLSLIGDMT